MVSKVDDGTDTNPGMFSHRGSGSSQNNVKNFSIGRCRSCGNHFSSATNRTANACEHREKGFQLTYNSQTIFFERVKEVDDTFKFQDVPIKSFEQAKEAAKHTKDTWVTSIKSAVTACLRNAETVREKYLTLILNTDGCLSRGQDDEFGIEGITCSL